VLQEDDILFTIAGTIGRVALVPASVLPANTNQAVAIVRPDHDKVLPRFLYYVLGDESRVRQAHTRVVQSVQANFSLAELSSLEIPLPELPVQRAIAHILGTLDDKIELNRRMNETLEAMARALFKSWFVDFDPVRAKAEGRDPGLPKPLADLFPDSFEDSELGKIPKGWEVRPLRDLTGYLSRGIGPDYVETGGICVLNQKCIRDRRIDFSKARRHDQGKKSADGRLLQRLDVLVNSTGVGTLGRVAQLWHLPGPTIVDSHVTVLRAASGVDPWFLGVGLTGREYEIEALGEGSTGQTELSRARLGDLACLAPPSEVQEQFGLVAEPLLGRLSNGQQESQTIGMLRDALLPKLISGELRVEDAERFVGATV
jgi:type I restriction enzyme S subunit